MGKELEYLEDVLKSGILSGYKGNAEGNDGGKWVQRLESQFRDYYGVKYALACNSATSGLFMALKACGIGHEDIVMTTPITFSATSSTIMNTGAYPFFCDVDPVTYNMVPQYTQGISCLLPVHLMGYPCDMDEVTKFSRLMRVPIVEDCAQAIGAEYDGQLVGTIGDIGVFSFNQGKQLSCGEGGMILTDDDGLAYIMKMIRNHGETQGNIIGFNFRMTELQAAIASARFENIDKTLRKIRTLCNYVSDNLNVQGLITPEVAKGNTHSYMYYPLRVIEREIGFNRDEFQKRCLAKGVFFGMGGYKPLYYMSLYEMFKRDLPETERAYKEMTFTNIFRPPMTLKRVKEIIGIIRDVVYNREGR